MILFFYTYFIEQPLNKISIHKSVWRSRSDVSGKIRFCRF